MIELKNLTQKYFYGAKAVDDVSFSLADGDKLAIFAKEGGGKTSTLKAIAGLYPVESGCITIDGVDVTSFKPKNRGVRMVYFGEEGLFRYRTVEYNLAYPLKLRRYPKDEIASTVYSVAERFGLLPYMKELTYRISKEESVRLALARTALRPAQVTLIDNLFGVLNGYSRSSLFNELLPEILKLSGNVILATDSCTEALSFGDKLGVLSSGRLIDFGFHEDVITKPNGYFTDVALCANKTHGITHVCDGFVMIDDEVTVDLTEYDKDDVLFSYELIEQADGREFVPYRFEYIPYGGMIAVSVCGERLKVSERKTKYFVAIDTKSMRLYDISYEKPLTIA